MAARDTVLSHLSRFTTPGKTYHWLHVTLEQNPESILVCRPLSNSLLLVTNLLSQLFPQLGSALSCPKSFALAFLLGRPSLWQKGRFFGFIRSLLGHAEWPFLHDFLYDIVSNLQISFLFLPLQLNSNISPSGRKRLLCSASFAPCVWMTAL